MPGAPAIKVSDPGRIPPPMTSSRVVKPVGQIANALSRLGADQRVSRPARAASIDWAVSRSEIRILSLSPAEPFWARSSPIIPIPHFGYSNASLTWERAVDIGKRVDIILT